MSEKRRIATLRILTCGSDDWLEGPVVSPDKRRAAENLSDLHELIRQHGAFLLYDSKWNYIPAHALVRATRGGNFFALPWPLVDEDS